ncbi:Type-4 uracil-DNA glycosylase [Candidatus Bipolaricaulis anaerobius]|uniref:Type-4 uracil-DNA glycosylase n=1 Tax=Candidatus Bipolaricaulis anaerobius TaxID=2026885 RepID=A0A2X3MJF4_9BACT|nr:Type-4 uracil-DNA glycosylase [Candidatus Bipolaricaulis anaerobius]
MFVSGGFELTLDLLAQKAADCRRCPLADSRRTVVFGEGDPRSPLLFVGEGPGEVEDETGRPFVGPAGQLLTQILASVGLSREGVYIANMVKCRPPGNRVPTRQEVEACWDWLAAQIALIRPRVIVTLGNTPTQWFLGGSEGITQVRGTFHRWKGGIEVFPMYHPSYLLRNASKAKGSPKYQTWLDIKTVKERISLLCPTPRA